MSDRFPQYLSRLVDLAAPDAEASFDRLFDADGRVVVTVPGARLVLVLDDAPPAPPSALAPLRVAHGALHVPRRVPMRVDVELLRWSDDRTEIGLRPVSNRGRGKAFHAAAWRGIDAVAASMRGVQREAIPSTPAAA